jgi:catechol 2,3-dioxygenase-like lactoylglutathione lyase family enzyme
LLKAKPLAVPCLSWREHRKDGLQFIFKAQESTPQPAAGDPRNFATANLPMQRCAKLVLPATRPCQRAVLSSPVTRHERHLEQRERPVNMNMKLEVVIVPVSDVDRAKAFYEKAGFRLDIDIANENFRGIQFTPPRSEVSIIFGKGVTSVKSGSAELVLAVDDVDAARKDLIARGVEVSEIFHYAGGPFNNAIENPRVAGRDPEGRSYFSFASFEDPDGNRWLLQEITTRLPGREWK